MVRRRETYLRISSTRTRRLQGGRLRTHLDGDWIADKILSRWGSSLGDGSREQELQKMVGEFSWWVLCVGGELWQIGLAPKSGSRQFGGLGPALLFGGSSFVCRARVWISNGLAVGAL